MENPGSRKLNYLQVVALQTDRRLPVVSVPENYSRKHHALKMSESLDSN